MAAILSQILRVTGEDNTVLPYQYLVWICLDCQYMFRSRRRLPLQVNIIHRKCFNLRQMNRNPVEQQAVTWLGIFFHTISVASTSLQVVLTVASNMPSRSGVPELARDPLNQKPRPLSVKQSLQTISDFTSSVPPALQRIPNIRSLFLDNGLFATNGETQLFLLSKWHFCAESMYFHNYVLVRIH